MRLVKIVIIFVLLLFLSVTAWAQEAGDFSLTYSVPAEGEITDAAFSQTWTLKTASADRIRVRVERADGNLIPDVAILDVNSQPLQISYGPDRTSAAAVIEDFMLPTGGEYRVLVQRMDGGSGLTTGTYTLTVSPRATAQDNPNNQFEVGPVEAGTPISGEITAAHWYHRYTYTAQGPDAIEVVARRSSGTLFPEVDVLDANGTSLRYGYVEYSGDFARIDRVDLPGAGDYTIVVTRAQGFNGETVGNYDLSLNVIGAGEGSPLLAPAAGNDVVYDTPVQGTINARWYEDWKLTAQAGDTISLIVTSDAATAEVDGNLQPEVILLGGSGQELRHGYTERDGATAIIDHFQLDGPGTYTARVSRAQGQTGLTAGPYTLLVRLDGSGEDSPALSEVSGVVEIGTEAQGEITNAQWVQTWTLQGQADQEIDILVTRADGTLVPLVEILDANGQLLRNSYFDATRDRVLLERYTLPGTGEYQIIVYRDNQQNGYTTGTYTLLVRLHSDE